MRHFAVCLCKYVGMYAYFLHQKILLGGYGLFIVNICYIKDQCINSTLYRKVKRLYRLICEINAY